MRIDLLITPLPYTYEGEVNELKVYGFVSKEDLKVELNWNFDCEEPGWGQRIPLFGLSEKSRSCRSVIFHLSQVHSGLDSIAVGFEQLKRCDDSLIPRQG